MCGWFALMGVATPARGQCSPQELAKLTASDAAAGDIFGYSVAVSGDTAVVGAYLDDHSNKLNPGSAYVFVRTGGVWTQQARLIASEPTQSDFFGYSVAISGDTVVVGALQADEYGTNAGLAYVFVRAGGVWTHQATLVASDTSLDDFFGASVAISGDTTVVGSYADSVYVFVRTGGVWTQQQKLIASDAVPGDSFGLSVAFEGDTMVISAPQDDHTSLNNPGSAYVFVRTGPPGSEVWTEQAKLTASDAGAGDKFGDSVSVSGDTVVVGVKGNDHSGWSNAGAAYVYVRAGGVWTQQQKLTASDAATIDFFGNSVALAGDTAMIGAFEDDHAGGISAGSVYIFVRSGGLWTQQAKLTSSDAAESDNFGASVALDGDTVLIGAYRDDDAGSQSGSAYVFDPGCAVACCAGDFDGDNVVTNADVPDFIVAMLAGTACPAPPACCPGDFNSDGLINGIDQPAFIAKLLGGGACP
jgi:FG-GAP repeat